MRSAPEACSSHAVARSSSSCGSFPTLRWRTYAYYQTAWERGFLAGCVHFVAFRIGPECISICLNDLTRPHWCGNDTIAPEKCGIGPESSNSMWRLAWVCGLLSLASVRAPLPGGWPNRGATPGKTHRAELAAPVPPVTPHRCRASCWHHGSPPCVRPNFPEQGGLFPEQ
jgi:hypothetical protein